VVGTKTLTIASPPPVRRATSPEVVPVTKPRLHTPCRGNWISTTWRNEFDDWVNSVTNTCFIALYRPRTTGMRATIDSPKRTSLRPT